MSRREGVEKLLFMIFLAGWMMIKGFSFVAPLCPSLSNEWQPTRGGHVTSADRGGARPHQRAAVTMRGLHNKGKNGPGLTGVQRVLNTRERVNQFDDPCKVMISNLDYSLTEDDVRKFCSTAGPVASVKIVKRRYAKTSKGFGFVEFIQPLMATIAIEELSGKELHGRVVELKPAITPQERRRKEMEREWRERLASERESRSASDDGIASEGVEEEGDKGKESETKEIQQSTTTSKPSASEFLGIIGRRVKPKPAVPTDPESE